MPDGDAAIPRPGVSHASYKALFDEALVGMGVADLHGNLLAFNDAMLAPGGYTREDIEAMGNVAHLYASRDERERVLQRVREHGYVWREEVQFLRKDGSAYDALLTLTPVRFMEQPCLYATVEDVTEQKRLQEQRRELEASLFKAQKMEAVGQMTAGIAHDFNNLLAIIRASCDMLTLCLDSEAEETKEHLESVRDASQRGAEMIQKLLGFSRTADLDLAPVELGELVEQMRGMIRAVAPSLIEITVQCVEGSIAICDRAAVEQMVLNLATNARDAMPEGGALRLVVEPWTARPGEPSKPPWIPEGEYVRVAVVDTGCGMDEKVRARALEPFFTTKPPGAGTGLGLPMVYGLAKQQGGFLELLSEPGSGTTVNLYFRRVVD
ncbi:MAG TPA: ATP-binding protein [Longimicrobiales bacterium]|nr:ATP-binding protein [Longimicrobiales bacterium]